MKSPEDICTSLILHDEFSEEQSFQLAELFQKASAYESGKLTMKTINIRFPNCKISAIFPAVFPKLISANISYKILANLTEASFFGTILKGPTKPAHVLERGVNVLDINNMVYLTAQQ